MPFERDRVEILRDAIQAGQQAMRKAGADKGVAFHGYTLAEQAMGYLDDLQPPPSAPPRPQPQVEFTAEDAETFRKANAYHDDGEGDDPITKQEKASMAQKMADQMDSLREQAKPGDEHQRRQFENNALPGPEQKGSPDEHASTQEEVNAVAKGQGTEHTVDRNVQEGSGRTVGGAPTGAAQDGDDAGGKAAFGDRPPHPTLDSNAPGAGNPDAQPDGPDAGGDADPARGSEPAVAAAQSGNDPKAEALSRGKSSGPASDEGDQDDAQASRNDRSNAAKGSRAKTGVKK